MYTLKCGQLLSKVTMAQFKITSSHLQTMLYYFLGCVHPKWHCLPPLKAELHRVVTPSPGACAVNDLHFVHAGSIRIIALRTAAQIASRAFPAIVAIASVDHIRIPIGVAGAIEELLEVLIVSHIAK